MFLGTIKKFASIPCKKLIIANHIARRNVRISSSNLAESKQAEQAPFNIMDELAPPELTEEEIEAKRNKHRMPERLYRVFVKKEVLPIENEYDFELQRLRRYYGRQGKATGLNPGIQWPTRDEILETMEYDKIFHPPLQEMLKNVETARLAEEARKRAVEDEVDKNMANHGKWLDEYYQKIEKKSAEVRELREKRERLIEEISEYLGYDIDPRDPRFQEAVDQREKEKKKALKVKKAQEGYEKMLAKLKQMSEQ